MTAPTASYTHEQPWVADLVTRTHDALTADSHGQRRRLNDLDAYGPQTIDAILSVAAAVAAADAAYARSVTTIDLNMAGRLTSVLEVLVWGAATANVAYRGAARQ